MTFIWLLGSKLPLITKITNSLDSLGSKTYKNDIIYCFSIFRFLDNLIIAFVRKHYIPKGGKKYQPAMNKQKKVIPWGGTKFCLKRTELEGNSVRNLVRNSVGNSEGKEMRSERFLLYWPYFLFNQDGNWYTYDFWSSESESGIRNDLSFLVFFWWIY